MKCPKCGYTSFESYDVCRECSADLVAFKESHGITPLVIPASVRATMAAELLSGQAAADNTENDDMFSFNLPEQQSADNAPAASPFDFNQASASTAAPFSFDAPSAASQPDSDDPFASLLESTPTQAAAAAPAQGMELNSFSWDDTPTPGQDSSASKPKSADDDFNSLFGDLGGGKK